MAGGLFGRPFTFNIKCIIFSLLIMAIFLYNLHLVAIILFMEFYG